MCRKPEPSTGSASAGREALYRTLLPIAALVVLLLYNCLFTKGFADIELKDGRLFGAMIDILHRGAPVILLAIGMTLVIATRGIDLSVGSVMAISGATAALLLTRSSMPVPVVILAALGAAAAAGLWNGMLVSYLGIQPFVATLILMVAGRGIGQLMTDGMIITFTTSSACQRFAYLGTGSFLALPTTVFIAAGVFLVTAFIVRKTVVGTCIEAVGGNETAASYCGINAGMVKVFTYVFCALCAGIAGLILTADVKAADASTVGLNKELDAILSAVIGGTLFSGGRFNLTGSVAGALIIQTLTTQILMNGVDYGYTLAIKAVVVIAVCLAQSPSFRAALSGLRTGRSARKWSG